MDRSIKTDQELANIMGSYRNILRIQALSMNIPALANINEAITVIKKEYHIE